MELCDPYNFKRSDPYYRKQREALRPHEKSLREISHAVCSQSAWCLLGISLADCSDAPLLGRPNVH